MLVLPFLFACAKFYCVCFNRRVVMRNFFPGGNPQQCVGVMERSITLTKKYKIANAKVFDN